MTSKNDGSDWNQNATETNVEHDEGVSGVKVSDELTDASEWTTVFGSGVSTPTVTGPDGSSRDVVELTDPTVLTNGTSLNPHISMAMKQDPNSSKNRSDGGFVWRYQNIDNYYYVRFVANDQDIEVGYISDGTETIMAQITPTRNIDDQWAELKVEHRRGIINVYTRSPGGSWNKDAGVGEGRGPTTVGQVGFFINYGAYFANWEQKEYGNEIRSSEELRINDFEGQDTGSAPEHWNQEASDGTIETGGYDSNQEIEWTSNANYSSGFKRLSTHQILHDPRPTKFQYMYRETTNNQGFGVTVRSGAGDIAACGTANPSAIVYDGSFNPQNIADPRNNGSYTKYGVWRRFTMYFDWEDGNVTYLWEDVGGGGPDQTFYTNFRKTPTDGLRDVTFDIRDGYGSGGGLDIEVDRVSQGWIEDGSFTFDGQVYRPTFDSFDQSLPFSPSMPNGLITFSLDGVSPSGRQRLKIDQDASFNSSGGTKFVTKDVDVTGFNTLDVTTEFTRDGPYDKLRIELGSQILYESASAHGSTDRSFNISGISGTVTLRIGHKISISNTREPESIITNVTFR